MKPRVDNPYGYKICYQERGSKELITKFMTHNYKLAVKYKLYYVRCKDIKLKKPTWCIIPITRKEVKAGIWRQVPF